MIISFLDLTITHKCFFVNKKSEKNKKGIDKCFIMTYNCFTINSEEENTMRENYTPEQMKDSKHILKN